MWGNRDQLEAQQTIQDLIAQDAPLEETLTSICRMVELQAPGTLSSIMLYDPKTQSLSLIAGNLPEGYRAAMQGIPLGEQGGSCGQAAYHLRPIMTEDIQHDPHWGDYRDLAAQYGLRACWSYPVLTKDSRLLGTFASYYAVPARPSGPELESISRAAGLVSLAVERQQDRRALQEKEQYYRSLFTHHPDGVFSLDLDGVFRSVNPAARHMTGFSEEQLLGQHYSCFVAADSSSTADKAFLVACQGEPQHFEVQAVDAHGATIHLAITNLPVVIDKQVIGVYGIARDITQRKRDETQLRLLERSVEASTNGILIVDAQQPTMPVVYANAAFLAMSGYAREEVIGKDGWFLPGPETDPQSTALIRKRIAEQREVHVTTRHYRKDGSTFWNELFISHVPDTSGQVTHFIGIHHDVTEQKRNESQLAFRATHDPLTGVANRTLLEQRLEHDYHLMHRHRGKLEVLFIDLDDFKSVNDSLGHAAGDRLLIAAVQRLQCLLSPEDTLARFGGDEFVILLPSISTAGRGLPLAEQARHVLAEPYRLNEQEVSLSASLGVASTQTDATQPSVLIQHADLAMYQAKMQGGNAVCAFLPDMKERVQTRITLRKELAAALENEELELHYQPLLRSNGCIEGFEALVRWRHPTMGYIPPLRFITLAEQTGQIMTLGDWVMRRACRDIKILNDALDTHYWVAVNVSPVQFHRPDFLSGLNRIIKATGVSPRWLDIELTEGVLMEGTDAAIATLQALRSQGIGTAIDDFGTGYSSLSYLRDLPISKVKLDRSFIQDITDCSRSSAIVQGVIHIAHTLGLQIVAEGVETSAQYQDLVAKRCDLFQGYLFARTMPLDALKNYLLNAGAPQGRW